MIGWFKHSERAKGLQQGTSVTSAPDATPPPRARRPSPEEEGIVRGLKGDNAFRDTSLLGLSLILFGVLLWVMCPAVRAQSLDVSGAGEISLWPHSDRCYQHSMGAAAEIEVEWGYLFAEGFLRGQWWGACDTKLEGSIFSAEAGRALERSHGGNAGIELWEVQAGVTVHRQAVHHFWRHGNRTGHFPEDNNARAAQQRCRAGDLCPSIGYHQGVRGYLGYEDNGLNISVTTPPYQWKDLTLPWPDWMLDASFEWNAWRIRLAGQTGGLRESTLDMGLFRHLVQGIWVGARAGRIPAPGWREPLERVALTLRLQ